MGLNIAPATLPAMRAVVHDDLDAFSALVPRWRAILDKDPNASVFHTPQYLATWWSEFGAGLQPRIVEIVSDDDEPVGITPLALHPDGVMRFAGDHETTDYRGPISAIEDRDAVAAATIDAAARDRWSSFEMDNLASDSGWPEAFTRAAKSAGHAVSEERGADACPRVLIPGSHDAYLQALPGKMRHEIQRKARRLARDASPYEIRLSTEHTLDDDLEKFFAMHRSSDGPKGRFMHEGMATFFGSFAWMLFSQGWLRIALLEIDGEAWAGCYAYSYRGVWGVWNSAFDHRRRELAPGMVLMGECIRLAAEEGCHLFDFLRGTEPYKYRFGASDVPLVRLVATAG